MPWLPWEDSYAVGIRVFDEQHQGLFGLVNNLHDGLTENLSQAELRQVLAELIRYTMTHFRAEEVAMEGYCYPQGEAHFAQHEAFTRQVLDLSARQREKEENIDLQLLQFLGEWLQQHILSSDRQMSEFLRTAGLS